MKNLQFPFNNQTTFSIYFGSGDYKTLTGIHINTLVCGIDDAGSVYYGNAFPGYGFTGIECQKDWIRFFVKGQVQNIK